MKEYIDHEAAINAALLAKSDADITLVPGSFTNGFIEGAKIKENAILNALADVPAADVVEVDVKDLRVKKAIQTLCEFYSTAKKSDYVQKPLAWALYQTWKSFDKMDGGVNDEHA